MQKRLLFFIAAVALIGTGFFFRASNGRTARAQADDLIHTDAQAASSDTALASLKSFVQDHMGASVSFTLKGSYDRAQAAAQTAATAVAAAAAAQAQIYADAQRACTSKADSLVQAHCNQAYLAAHLTNAPAPAPVPAPKLADYQYKLKSPIWTPDLAGALFIGGIVALGFSVPFRRRGHHRLGR